MNISPKQLTFAREYRGYTQSELASRIVGLSQSNLSKFEKGIGVLSDEVLKKIIECLGFPEGFYTLSISNNVENAHYRRKSGITKRTKEDIEKSNKLIGYIVDQMADSIDFPTFTLKTIDLEDDFTPEYAAQFTRRYVGIMQGTVKEICTMLERYGIIIVEQTYDKENFDGVSFLTDKGIPVMVINRDFSNDRKRLTIAHELGHIVMHLSREFAIPEYRDKEDEAFRFASEFLMPEKEIRNSLYGLRFSSLMPLKLHWLTSMAAIIRRAWSLGCIDKNRYQYLNIELSRHHYKKREPGMVFLDLPQSFTQAYQLFKTELGYTDFDLSRAFQLPIDVIQRFCGNAPQLKVVSLRR